MTPHRGCGLLLLLLLPSALTKGEWVVSFTLWPLYSQEGTAVPTELEGGGLRASLEILENRITLDPARNHGMDHPAHSVLTYELSYPNSNRSYIISICVNAGHHNRLREVWRGSICDMSTCDHFRFYAVLLPHSCVLCSVMWLDDYRGWIGKEMGGSSYCMC